jgi:hypothetical protein
MVDIMTDHDKNPDASNSQVSGDGNDRRRFLGAGVAATPFLLTLVSQPALGVTCFTPSRSLSRNTSLSQEGKNGECLNAESPGNYKTQQTEGGAAYHWPAAVPPSTPMHPLFYMGGAPGKTKFTKMDGNIEVSMSLGEAIKVNVSGQAHKHLIGAYLNKMGGNGAVIPDNVLTAQDILNIWQEYATKGYYEPMAGIQWYEEEIKAYLTSNGIVK